MYVKFLPSQLVSRSPKSCSWQLRGRGSPSNRKKSQSRNVCRGLGFGQLILVRAWTWQWRRQVLGQTNRSPWDRCSRTPRPASQTAPPSGSRRIRKGTGPPSAMLSTTTSASGLPSPSSRWAGNNSHKSFLKVSINLLQTLSLHPK